MNTHNLRTSFFLAFAGMGILVFIGAAVPIFVQHTKYVRDNYRSNLSRALELTVSKHPLDSAALAHLAQSDPLHEEVVSGLIEIAAAFDLAFIYLVTRQGAGADMTFHFVLSTYDTPGTRSLEEWPEPPAELTEVFVTGNPVITSEYTDAWGSFVSAFFPVIENGQVIAVWGADFPLDTVNALLWQSRFTLLIAFLVSNGIALAFASFVSRSLTKPISETKNRKDEVEQSQRELIKIRDGLKEGIDNLNNHISKMSAHGRHLK